MNAVAPDLFLQLQAQRAAILRRVLWVLLGAMAAAPLFGTFVLGSLPFELGAWTPHLLNVAIVSGALWLAYHRHATASVVVIVVATFLGTALPLLQHGIRGNVLSLFVFFIPLTLAGLVLDRTALLATAGTTVAVLLAAPALNGASLHWGDPLASDPGWTVAVQVAIVIALVAYFLDRFALAFQATLHDATVHEATAKRAALERLRTHEALAEERAFTDRIVESLPGIFYVLGENGTYFKWNRNFAEVLGYTADELAAIRPVDLFDDDQRDLVAHRIAQAFETGHHTVEAHVVTKDGRRIPYLLNGTRVTLGGATYLAGIGIDKSEIDAARARIETLDGELVERLERITALHEIDKAITGSTDLATTLDVILQQVRRRLHVDAAAVLLYKPGTMTLRFGEGSGFRGAAVRATRLELGEAVAGRAAAERTRVVIDDPAELRATFARSAVLDEENAQAYVALPLVAKGQLQGVLELYHRSPLAPSDDWLTFLTTLGTQAAIALDNTTMLESLERSNTNLLLAYDTTIEGWARALDLRDEETEGHSRRVTDMTVRLAERMGVPDDELPHVRRGALLHDIGKMGVPDAILLKPGALAPDEWDVMKRHTTYARELLAPIPFLRPALDIPYAHHERWDGTGYPLGLAGEAIPFAARLFAVVDVYDALTSDRPYRPAWSEADAVAHIREQAGRHFDPAVVAAFLELLDDGPASA